MPVGKTRNCQVALVVVVVAGSGATGGWLVGWFGGRGILGSVDALFASVAAQLLRG